MMLSCRVSVFIGLASCYLISIDISLCSDQNTVTSPVIIVLNVMVTDGLRCKMNACTSASLASCASSFLTALTSSISVDVVVPGKGMHDSCNGTQIGLICIYF